MLPKSYIIKKWVVYGLATLALFTLQSLLLNNISVLGVTPFLYPLLPALVSSFEGQRRGSVFSLVVGVVCDLAITTPFVGFYTILFTLIGLIAAAVGENLMSPGWLCGLNVSLIALLLHAVVRLLIYLLTGDLHPILMVRIAFIECAITLPAMLPALPLYRAIHRYCAADY